MAGAGSGAGAPLLPVPRSRSSRCAGARRMGAKERHSVARAMRAFQRECAPFFLLQRVLQGGALRNAAASRPSTGHGWTRYRALGSRVFGSSCDRDREHQRQCRESRASMAINQPAWRRRRRRPAAAVGSGGGGGGGGRVSHKAGAALRLPPPPPPLRPPGAPHPRVASLPAAWAHLRVPCA